MLSNGRKVERLVLLNSRYELVVEKEQAQRQLDIRWVGISLVLEMRILDRERESIDGAAAICKARIGKRLNERHEGDNAQLNRFLDGINSSAHR